MVLVCFCWFLLVLVLRVGFGWFGWRLAFFVFFAMCGWFLLVCCRFCYYGVVLLSLKFVVVWIEVVLFGFAVSRIEFWSFDWWVFGLWCVCC